MNARMGNVFVENAAYSVRRGGVGLLLAAVCLYAAGTVCAQEAVSVETGTVHLADVVALAIERNPGLAAARERAGAARKAVWEARAWPNPTFAFSRMPSDHTIHTARGPMERKYSVEQRLPFPGKTFLRAKIAAARADEAQARYRSEELLVRARATQAFARLAFLTRAVSVNREQEELVSRFARVAERKYAAGRQSQSDVLRAQVEQAKIGNELITLEARHRAAEARLNTVLDRDTGSSLGEPASLEELPFALSPVTLQRAALGNRPEILALRARIARARNSRRLSGLEFLPDLGLGYEQTSIGASAASSGMDGPDARAFMLKLSVPLWLHRPAAGRLRAGHELAAARAALKEAENETDAAVVERAAEVEIHSRLSRLFRDTVIPLAEAALGNARRNYEADRASFLELLDSQRSLIGFKLEYHEHLMHYWVERVGLEQVLGMPLSELEGGKK